MQFIKSMKHGLTSVDLSCVVNVMQSSDVGWRPKWSAPYDDVISFAVTLRYDTTTKSGLLTRGSCAPVAIVNGPKVQLLD